ncbi:MAG TPA: GON domain-containing protein [Symbiobacteriaceae bacterium]|nr:GON domain-containing protein [Symbiobacteriaceae bacterium]
MHSHRTQSNLSRATLLLMMVALILAALLPASASAAPLPQSCAEVRLQNPAAADGPYTLALQSHTAQIYCADMAGTPKEYISLAHTGGSYNYSFSPGAHVVYYTRNYLIYGTDANTSYLKIRLDPVTLVVDQKDVTFANLVSIGSNGYDPQNPSFKPTPRTADYANASDCYNMYSNHGRANVDLTGTDFAIDDSVSFAVGGWAQNGSISMDANRQVVNMTGGGWCGGAGPTGPLKLKLLTPLVPMDQTPPVTTAMAPSGWQNHDVTVTLSATDDSSVAATYWQLDNNPVQQGTSVLISPEGAHSLAFWSVDQAGNVEAAQTVLVQIDKMAPMIIGSASTTGWSNQPVTVTFTCSDTLSGVQSCEAPITVSTEGVNHIVEGNAVDNAGNATSAMVSNINIDLTAPTIAGSTDQMANAAGWYNAAVTVSFTCADALSGVATCADATTLSEGANQSVTGSTADRAANTASATVSGINVDMTAPTITGNTDRMANAAGWYNAAVHVSFTCADTISGVATCAGATTLGEGANQSVSGSAADWAANTASTMVAGINVDQTAPTVSYAGNAGTYTVDQQISITCSASDSLSGVAANTCQAITGPAYNFALGSNSISASATDNAGNVGSASSSFSVVIGSDSLCNLTQQFVSNKGIANALCAKLDAAMASAAKGNANSKAGQIGAYINQVQAQAGKTLTAEQAAILIQLAPAL